jgi:hypothetical protein
MIADFSSSTLQIRGNSTEDLDRMEASLQRLAKKGGKSSRRGAQKLARFQEIVAEGSRWSEPLAQVKRLHGWIVEVEHLLDGSLVQAGGEKGSNETVGRLLDAWREQMAKHLRDAPRAELEQECLTTVLQVLTNLRPYLLPCDDRSGFPRTNHEMKRSIRALKTPDRRVSGCTNGNSSLLRSGRGVASAAWWEQDAGHRQQFEQQVGQLDRGQWRILRQETTTAHREQRTRFRFRHHREAFLASLEARCKVTTPTPLLP